jgi:hypothetical protein
MQFLKRTLWMLHQMIVETDTTFARFLVGLTSLLWGGIILTFHPPEISVQAYWLMNHAGGRVVWAWCFVIHGCLALWRVFSRRDMPIVGLLVNAYGLLIWAMLTGSYSISTGHVQPILGKDLVTTLMQFWVMVRTEKKWFPPK